jgi:hypothetical protein
MAPRGSAPHSTRHFEDEFESEGEDETEIIQPSLRRLKAGLQNPRRGLKPELRTKNLRSLLSASLKL